MKPRPLGNKQKELRDEALCLASEGLHSIRAITRHNQPTREELLQTITESTIKFFDIIQCLSKMDTEEP